jgi:hypothetical protein
MPITVSEWRKIFDRAIGRQHARDEEQLRRRRDYVIAVAAQDIPVYRCEYKNPDGSLIDCTNYESWREHLRLRMSNDLEGSFIELACDDCGTYLFDAAPAMQLSSNPPQFRASCCGCGRNYTLPLDARIHCGVPEHASEEK